MDNEGGRKSGREGNSLVRQLAVKGRRTEGYQESGTIAWPLGAGMTAFDRDVVVA